MALSQENIDKLCLTGLYKCDPVLKWLPEYKRSDPYWCKNWTFKVRHSGNSYYMVDTYWSSNSFSVELNDDNFSKFTLLFDFNDVVECSYNWDDYDDNDKWFVATDSGGWNHAKHYIRKDAVPVKAWVVGRISREIEGLKHDLESAEHLLEQVKNDEIDLRYVP